jgi:hypothetical protein
MKSPIPSARRRTGNVARLPKAVRDSINQLLVDGVPYAHIAQRLTEQGHPLTENNVSRWSRGGHRDWLRDQERLDKMGRTRDFAIKSVQTHGGSTVHEASLSLAASQVYELLTHFDTDNLREKMDKDPVAFNRLLNTLARLADEGLKYERYRAEVAERKAKIEKELADTKPGGISLETRRRIEQELKLM